MKLVAVTALLAVPLLAGCPKPRTSAATQPTPLAFDVAKSDPKAIEVVDAGTATIGGAAPWEALKELRFSVTYNQDGVSQAEYEHAWDRWNGRHFFVATDMATTHGKADDVKALEIKHDLFDRDKSPWAAYDGTQLMRGESGERAAVATKQLMSDLYYLAIVHKLKDPGVILAIDNAEVLIPETVPACKPSCTAIKVTFEKGVGTETWYVNYNNSSHLPEVIEQQRGAGRIGFLLSDWVDAGGLKWPTKLQNIGLPGEVIKFDAVKVGEPDDNTYEVQVR